MELTDHFEYYLDACYTAKMAFSMIRKWLMRKPKITANQLFLLTIAPRILRMHDYIIDDLRELDNVRVLDAGCGSRAWLKIDGAHVTGLDCSQYQLDRAEHLDLRILGDIQSYDLSSQKYDFITCFDVIEHLEQPDQAIERFYEGLNDNGLLLIGAPNYRSLWAQVTKYTPYFVHVLYYRYILGKTTAGKNDQGPFPTYMRPSICPREIESQWQRRGGTTVYLDEFEGHMQNWLRETMPAFNFFMTSVSKVSNQIALSNFMILLRKST